MGSGSWNTSSYSATRSFKAASGTPNMAYTANIRSGKVAAGVHDDLDPKKVNGAASDRAGQNIRESLDSDEHPNSTAIAVLFDETGSMGGVPTILVDKLPDLWGLILKNGYVEDPQLLFGAIGDARWREVAPFQVAQFESDNRSDEDLEKIYLEGGGGGGGHETYELAAYYMLHHTYIDCFEKRDKRGYLFIIGDEAPYDVVSRENIVNVLGGKAETDVPTKDVFKELQKKYNVFLIRPLGGGYGPGSAQEKAWRQLLPAENVINLDDDSAVAEVIALTLGMAEGIVGNIDEALLALDDHGASDATKTAVSKALATVGSGGALATSETPDGLGGDDSVERL